MFRVRGVVTMGFLADNVRRLLELKDKRIAELEGENRLWREVFLEARQRAAGLNGARAQADLTAWMDAILAAKKPDKFEGLCGAGDATGIMCNRPKGHEGDHGNDNCAWDR